MKILVTKDVHWQKKWDSSIENHQKGHYLQTSHWVTSYSAYNFDFELVLLLDHQEEILAGYCAIIPSFSFFKFYIIPFGPINFKASNIDLLENEMLSQAKKHKCCYFQITPFNTDHYYFNWLSNTQTLNNLKQFTPGKRFKNLAIPTRISIIDLAKYNTEAALLSSFKSSTRRHIRSANKKQLELVIATKETQIQEGYKQFETNAKEGSYSIRPWNQFGNTVINTINDGKGKMLLAYHEDELKGAIYILKSGNFYTYISGGSKKEKPDIKAGYFLHWEAIKLALKEGIQGYNIGYSGSAGVLRFKEGFNGLKIEYPFTSHKILRPLLFQMYIGLYPILKKNKKIIARLLSKK